MVTFGRLLIFSDYVQDYMGLSEQCELYILKIKRLSIMKCSNLSPHLANTTKLTINVTWGLPYHLHKSKQFLLLNQRSNPKAIVVLQVVVLVSVDCNPIHTAFPRFSPSLLKLVCVWFLLVWGLEVANLTEHST